jgi:hypothetical protein
MTLSTSADAMHSAQSSHIPKIGRSGRRNRSYSDAHVHFAIALAASESETTAFSNNKINDDVSYFDDNRTEDAEKELTQAASQYQHRGNRPRSKSESEPCHHRRISHKKKYPHHHQNRHHLNYGRHSPPPLSSSPCCGKMWVRPMPARRGGSGGEAHHVTTSALGDRHLSSLTSTGGSPSQSHLQATSKSPPAVEEAVSIDRSFIRSKTPSVDYSCTGLEDELMMMYTSSPPPIFGHGNTSYSLAHHSPSTCAFGESGKPIIRMKNHHEDDLFESEFLPVTPTKSGDVI